MPQQFDVNLKDWQLRGRSLLNRDAVGNYKFAHRSIMKYLFVKRFIELMPDQRLKIEWTDQMKMFIVEILRYYSDTHHKLPDLSNIDFSGIYKCKFRYSSKSLSDKEANQMISHFSFFDKHKNSQG